LELAVSQKTIILKINASFPIIFSILLSCFLFSNTGCHKDELTEDVFNETVQSRRIIYVNGYYLDNWIGENFYVGTTSKANYWNLPYENKINSFLAYDGKPFSNLFIDGAGSAISTGYQRYSNGYNYAQNNLSSLTLNLVPGEVFCFVTHSHGSAYGAGMAKYLIEQGYNVEQVVHIAAASPGQFNTPSEPYSYQIGYLGDIIVNEGTSINGIDRFAVAKRASGEQIMMHAFTRSTDIIDVLVDLKSAVITNNLSNQNNTQDDIGTIEIDNTQVSLPIIDAIFNIENNTDFEMIMIDGYFGLI